jgi:PncC family amidohydrolase
LDRKGVTVQNLVAEIQKKMVERGWKLALAESCTGGQLAAEIARRPGASSYFEGGVVAYSYDAKEQTLGVLPDTLKKYGAVSEQVAVQMANGVRRVLKSDWALSVTGIAGPDGGTPDKPVGTVWFALVGPGVEEAYKKLFDGGREDVQRASVLFALEVLWNAINEAVTDKRS